MGGGGAGEKALGAGGKVTKKSIKRGVGIAFKFRGPTALQRAIPLGTGTRAPFRPGSEPKLLQPRDYGPLESPVSPAQLGAPAGVQEGLTVPAALTLYLDSSH